MTRTIQRQAGIGVVFGLGILLIEGMEQIIESFGSVLIQVFALAVAGCFGWLAGKGANLKRPAPWVGAVAVCFAVAWFFVDGRVSDPEMAEFDGLRAGAVESVEVDDPEPLSQKRLKVAFWLLAAVSGGMVLGSRLAQD